MLTKLVILMFKIHLRNFNELFCINSSNAFRELLLTLLWLTCFYYTCTVPCKTLDLEDVEKKHVSASFEQSILVNLIVATLFHLISPRLRKDKAKLGLISLRTQTHFQLSLLFTEMRLRSQARLNRLKQSQRNCEITIIKLSVSRNYCVLMSTST